MNKWGLYLLIFSTVTTGSIVGWYGAKYILKSGDNKEFGTGGKVYKIEQTFEDTTTRITEPLSNDNGSDTRVYYTPSPSPYVVWRDTTANTEPQGPNESVGNSVLPSKKVKFSLKDVVGGKVYSYSITVPPRTKTYKLDDSTFKLEFIDSSSLLLSQKYEAFNVKFDRVIQKLNSPTFGTVYLMEKEGRYIFVNNVKLDSSCIQFEANTLQPPCGVEYLVKNGLLLEAVCILNSGEFKYCVDAIRNLVLLGEETISKKVTFQLEDKVAGKTYVYEAVVPQGAVYNQVDSTAGKFTFDGTELSINQIYEVYKEEFTTAEKLFSHPVWGDIFAIKRKDNPNVRYYSNQITTVGNCTGFEGVVLNVPCGDPVIKLQNGGIIEVSCSGGNIDFCNEVVNGLKLIREE